MGRLFPPAARGGCARDWTRRLVAEHRLGVDDLIWPIFVIEGAGLTVPVAAMPGVDRVSLDRLEGHVAEAARLGIPAVALFPATPAGQEGQPRAPRR